MSEGADPTQHPHPTPRTLILQTETLLIGGGRPPLETMKCPVSILRPPWEADSNPLWDKSSRVLISHGVGEQRCPLGGLFLCPQISYSE
jgi:hypothetical protein